MALMDKHLIIIGFGSQAKAWAANLRDSGWKIDIALRSGSTSRELVSKKGFAILELEKLNLSAPCAIAMLTPDHTHLEILKQLKGQLPSGSAVIYAHGHSFVTTHPEKEYPELKHLLLAPKAIASELRFQYENQGKLGAVYSFEAVEDDKEIQQWLLLLAKDLGITFGPVKSSFQEETVADLFSEQTILCSLLPYGALAAYNALRKEGVSREMAYFECWYEVKLIADTLMSIGPERFFDMISPNALIGSEKARHRLFDKSFHQKLETLLQEVSSGQFYQELEATNADELREQVKEFWRGQELSETHSQIGPSLF